MACTVSGVSSSIGVQKTRRHLALSVARKFNLHADVAAPTSPLRHQTTNTRSDEVPTCPRSRPTVSPCSIPAKKVGAKTRQLKPENLKTACQIANFAAIICAGFRNLEVAGSQR
jgi:hypothetical protein